MRFTFRTKLMGVVGIAAIAFLLLIIVNIFIRERVKEQITQIQKSYIPIIELGPKFQSQLENIRRSFQDAVAAHDPEMLEKTHEAKEIFVNQLTEAQGTIDPAKTLALQDAIEKYYSAAYDVSRRLMSGETGVTFVDIMADMQAKQIQAIRLLKDATTFDKDKLTQAFSDTTKALNTTARLQLVINISCLLSVLVFSLWLSRGVIWNLNELKTGFARFGKNDFSKPIQVVSNDEFGDVGRQANQMATLIENLLSEREIQAIKLKIINKELEAFSYSVAHDLRAPLRSMLGFSNALIEDYDDILPVDAKRSLARVTAAAQKMGQLIDGLLTLSRLTRTEMQREPVNLSKLTENILGNLQKNEPMRKAVIEIEKDTIAKGDSKLLEVVLMNLLGNAWKFTAKKPETQIEFGSMKQNGHTNFFVKDNGAGFDMLYKDKLFGTFQRLHSVHEFEGTGIGLATVQRIIHRHGGQIWAEAETDKGATFYFNLG